MGKVKEQLQETPQATAVAKPKPTLAVVSASNPYLEDAGDGIGTMLKFVKGKWRIGDTTIPIGTQYVAYLPQALKGWVCFKDGKVVDRRLGRTADRYQMPEREELGDSDQTKWEVGPDGKPHDPWGEQRYLPLLSIDGTEIVTYVTGSSGGRIAIQDLNRRYGYQLHIGKYQLHIGKLPIVALAVREYQHAQFGLMESPRFEIVGWTDPAGEAPTPTVADEMSDEIPF
jgi:hypothetical protein